MPSPFPGMNPYLERAEVWQDFHHRYITTAAELLGEQVRPNYFVKIEEHVFIHELSADERRPFGRPDLSIHPRGVAVPAGGVSTAPASVLIPPPTDELRIPYL